MNISDKNRNIVVLVTLTDANNIEEYHKISHYCGLRNFLVFHLQINGDAALVEAALHHLKHIENHIYCFISLNHYGLQSKRLNITLYEYFQVPFVLYIIDPIACLGSITDLAPNGFGAHRDKIFFYVFDKYEGKEWRDLFHGQINLATMDGGIPIHPNIMNREPQYERYIQKADRATLAIDYAYQGKTSIDIDSLYGDLPPLERRVVSGAVDRCLADCRIHYWKAFQESVEDAGLKNGGFNRFEAFMKAFTIIRLEERRTIVEELINERVSFLGTGFPDAFVSKHPEKFCNIRNANSYVAMDSSKVGISVGLSHWSTHSMRLFNTVLLGNAAMSEYDDASESIFGSETVHYFDYTPGKAASTLNHILDNPEQSFEKVEASFQRLKESNAIFASYENMFFNVQKLFYRKK